MTLIILDLDETLIHGCSEWIGRKPDFMAANQMIFVRPYAKAFIRLALQHHKVAIWTASYGQYTQEILTHLFDDVSDIEFIWDRKDCSLRSYDSGVEYFAKELGKLSQVGWDEGSYLIVDDMPEHIIGHEKNIIGIKPWFGSVSDNELMLLSKQLKLIKVIGPIKTQKETLKMAKYFAELDKPELTLVERILGVVSAAIIYGIGLGFGIYLIVGFVLQRN